MGYYRAGFDVIGYDIKPQPNYPFEFHQGDALTILESLLWGRKRGMKGRWAAVHLSPPCQRYTTLARGNNANVGKYPDLVPPVRHLLRAINNTACPNLPYVIENVPTAPLLDPITLCGEMFDLGVIRHRRFESNIKLKPLTHKKHRGRVAGYRHGEWFDGPYFAVYGDGGGKGTVAQWQQAMGIDWTTDRKEIAEAIPPAYTEYVGLQLLKEVA
ncbi:hypothetical protein [Mycobacterium phage WXIN]|nr:hypothetical protein [Mycobacterium phage WXIN]